MDKTEVQIANFDFKVKAYPNPFNSQAVIEFQNNESGAHVVIELYDITGNKKAILFDADVKKGMLYKAKVNVDVTKSHE